MNELSLFAVSESRALLEELSAAELLSFIVAAANQLPDRNPDTLARGLRAISVVGRFAQSKLENAK